MVLIGTVPSYTPTARRPARVHPRGNDGRRRPGPPRPAGAPPRYRGSGVLMSSTSHRRRPVTPATTVGLALLAAMITVWLGVVAHFGATVRDDSAEARARIPGTLAVVRVQRGETLTHLAARVAPDAPVAQAVARIRELNDLHSAALSAGQTLIAPVG